MYSLPDLFVTPCINNNFILLTKCVDVQKRFVGNCVCILDLKATLPPPPPPNNFSVVDVFLNSFFVDTSIARFQAIDNSLIMSTHTFSSFFQIFDCCGLMKAFITAQYTKGFFVLHSFCKSLSYVSIKNTKFE